MNGKLLSSQYKEHFSDFRTWEQLPHASDYLLFPGNMGPHLSIDESCLSSGEVYTFQTNKDGHGGPGSLVAVIHGTKAETVISVIEKIPRHKRLQVNEITLDLSASMMLIARTVFPKARITNDRFHVQKLYYDAIDELRVSGSVENQWGYAYSFAIRNRKNFLSATPRRFALKSLTFALNDSAMAFDDLLL